MNQMLGLGARWRHVVVAALAAVTFAVVYLAGVHTTTGQSAEETVLAASRFSYDPPLLALVTVPNLLVTTAVIAGLALLRRRWPAAIAAIAIIGVSSVLAQALKYDLLDRPPLHSMAENTFPSGHMTAFAAVISALLLVVPARIRPGIAIVGALGLSVVGTLLIRFGWHRPSDVVGAILLVTFVTAISQLGVSRRPAAKPSFTSERMLAGLSLAAIAIAAITLFAHLASWVPHDLASPMLIAQLSTISATLMSVSVTLWLLRHRRGITREGPAR